MLRLSNAELSNAEASTPMSLHPSGAAPHLLVVWRHHGAVLSRQKLLRTAMV